MKKIPHLILLLCLAISSLINAQPAEQDSIPQEKDYIEFVGVIKNEKAPTTNTPYRFVFIGTDSESGEKKILNGENAESHIYLRTHQKMDLMMDKGDKVVIRLKKDSNNFELYKVENTLYIGIRELYSINGAKVHKEK